MTENLKQLKDWRYDVDVEGIAWATFDRRKRIDEHIGQTSLRGVEPNRRDG